LEQQPLKNAVLQGFSLKNCKSLVQNRAPGYAGNVSALSISFGTGSRILPFNLISLLKDTKVAVPGYSSYTHGMDYETADFPPAEFIFTFASTGDAIAGEKKLIARGIQPAVMPLPDLLGPGCGICLRVSPAEFERARNALEPGFRGIYTAGPAAGSSREKVFRSWKP
jgi:hypothetical protein